jgi:hypothetical protein
VLPAFAPLDVCANAPPMLAASTAAARSAVVVGRRERVDRAELISYMNASALPRDHLAAPALSTRALALRSTGFVNPTSAPFTRQGCMDCRIKLARGAAEGRTRVSGNDG